jgi:cell division protein FtsB
MKYLAIICATIAVFLGLYAYYLDSRLSNTKDKLTIAESQKTAYKTQMEKEHNDKVELDKQIKSLEAKAKSDKSFNWYADISSSPVVIELHD